MATKFAFQCRNCGTVEPAGSAGENPVPGACHVCRHGVKFKVSEDGTGFEKIYEPENWIVLAELTDKQLAADFYRHGLKRDRVATHSPKFKHMPDGKVVGKTVIVTASESVGTKDKATVKVK